MKALSKFARHAVLLAGVCCAAVYGQSGNNTPGAVPGPNGGAAAPTAGGSQSPEGRAQREPYRDTDSAGGAKFNYGWIGLLGLAGLRGLLPRERTEDRLNPRA